MKAWRKFLWPLVPFYYIGALFIKKMYDWGIFSSKTYDFPLITVGNLSAGGTGKSPFVNYLVSALKAEKKVATLSRGYGRKTKGFRWVETISTVEEVGDEPLQTKQSFPNIKVVVAEERSIGIEQLMQEAVPPEVIILDDAFQHRKVTAGLQILLTAHYNLFCDDALLPAGDLREPISAAKRADIVIVTKCPDDLTEKEQQTISRKLKIAPQQHIYFTKIAYAREVISHAGTLALSEFTKQPFCLVTGIAKPEPMVHYLRKLDANFVHRSYPDHHNFSNSEIEQLQKEQVILTTQKDFTRLQYQDDLKRKLYYLPISTAFLAHEATFKKQLSKFITSY